MRNTDRDPEPNPGIAIAFLILVPDVAKGATLKECSQHCGQHPANSYAHHNTCSDKILFSVKDPKIGKKDAQFDESDAHTPGELGSYKILDSN